MFTELENKLNQVFRDDFLQPEIVWGEFWEVDGPKGIDVIPCEYFDKNQAAAEYLGEVWSIERVEGFAARLSAPGYTDCTEFAVFDTAEEAVEYLIDTYGDC